LRHLAASVGEASNMDQAMTKKTLCLNMIVKNEMANLRRCLDSVAPHIACWVIGDTGSTDGTQVFVREYFATRGIPGELHEFPFINFAQARNEALDRARASDLKYDYLLLADADMELTVQNPGFSEDLTAAAYKVLQRAGISYWNSRLLRRGVPSSYKGVTHEFLDIRAGETLNLEGISFIDHATGANRVDKFERDARLLRNAIAAEHDPGMVARYTFYLANTLRDSGQREAALKTYLERALLGNWQQEVFESLFSAAKLKEELGYSNDDILAAYAEATLVCPTRAEALHAASCFCRNKGIYDRGYEFAAKGLGITYPNDALFVQDWVYEYGLLDELAISAYWTGRYAECVSACDRLLSEGKMPKEHRDRVMKNREFAVGKLHEVTGSSKQEAEGPAIPRTLHFITGLDENFGNKPFSFVHCMAIWSALEVNRGFRAKVYYHHEPRGKYWDAIKNVVEPIHVDLPTEVFGNPVEHFAHKADVLRLRVLLEHGGIYLDLDTICQRPFEPLLDGRVVMGREERASEDGSRTTVGLCNATIIAPPKSEFLRLWYETYRDFSGGAAGDSWNKFSVQVPMKLAQDHPDLLHVEPASSFFWPSWDAAGIASMFSMDGEFPEAYSFHLWESQSWGFIKDLDPQTVLTADTTYNRIARRFVHSLLSKSNEDADDVADVREQFSRIYGSNTWVFGSGPGSLPDNGIEYRSFLRQFIVRNGIRKVVDLGCGDWQFSKYVDWSGVEYVGVDIVQSVVDANQNKYGSDSVRFEKFESLDQLPVADLLICKDVLQHLSNNMVKDCLAAFKKKYRFSLVTNDEEPAELQNTDIEPSGWRTLRLERQPFFEIGAIVFSWVVLWGRATTRKSTYLLYGNTAHAVKEGD
jgi:glycosyltransferase involved in cell wall biosynthesis/SAM-dependent methyltransferase